MVETATAIPAGWRGASGLRYLDRLDYPGSDRARGCFFIGTADHAPSNTAEIDGGEHPDRLATKQ